MFNKALAMVVALSLAGCAATRQIVADVAAQCGVKIVDALTKTEAVLQTATSADAALAAIAQIVGAASADAEAVYCVVKVAVDDMKAKRAVDGGAAPAASQLRPMVKGKLGLPSDPVAHGIALGEDILAAHAGAAR